MDAKLFRQGPSVDALDAGNAVFPEPFVEGLGRGRVGRLPAEPRNDVAGDPRSVRLETRGIDAVVADEGIGLAENLSVVGRIGDALRVADDPRIENDFPPGSGARAETYALIDGTVREGQNGFPDGACLRFIFALV
jgi:hypothetical protein